MRCNVIPADLVPPAVDRLLPKRWSSMSEHSTKGANLWAVTELSMALPGPPPQDDPHPETTPVGPFATREDADIWASTYIQRFGSGSWSVAPLRWPEIQHPSEPCSHADCASCNAAARHILDDLFSGALVDSAVEAMADAQQEFGADVTFHDLARAALAAFRENGTSVLPPSEGLA